MDLIARHYPDYLHRQPLRSSLLLPYAGHFALPYPAHLDRARHLWITQPDAPPVESLLAIAAQNTLHITRDAVLFVHWSRAPRGPYRPHLVCRDGSASVLVDHHGRRPIGRAAAGYDWARAFSWDNRLIVPTDCGVSLFALDAIPQETSSPPLAQPTDSHAPVQIAFLNGPIAWIPPSANHPGSAGAIRLIDTTWFPLTPAQGWPTGLLHLVPLRDGSILQLLAQGGDAVKLTIVSLDPVPPEQRQIILSLIGQLAEMDPARRQDAYRQLTQYGPALWQVAEPLVDSADPEVRSRLKNLLKSRITPLLGGMQLVDGTLQLLSRHPDGGALFYSRRGVALPRDDQAPEIVSPAWLSARPGMPVELLPNSLVRDLQPDKCHLTPWYLDWIVVDEAHGCRLFTGSAAEPLLRKSELVHSHFLGVDLDGRYIFQRPPGSSSKQHALLLIDPRLPDPRPRLPAWRLDYPDGAVGWDRNNWPAARHGQAWALGLGAWRPLDEKAEPFHTRAPAQPDPAPLLVDAQGNRYFDGKTALRVIHSDGCETLWPLPPEARGDPACDPHLVHSKEGPLFLYNHPGRLHRLRPLANGGFRLEATFSAGVPATPRLTRMWIDPFNRICIAHDTNRLAILFPQGYVPTETATLIPAGRIEEDIP